MDWPRHAWPHLGDLRDAVPARPQRHGVEGLVQRLQDVLGLPDEPPAPRLGRRGEQDAETRALPRIFLETSDMSTFAGHLRSAGLQELFLRLFK